LSTPIPPVFCKKSPQAIENKGRELEKESKEIPRVRKLLKTNGFQDLGALPKAVEAGRSNLEGDNRAFCIDVKGKGLRKKGFVSVWK